MDGAIEFLEDFRLFVGRNTNAIISYGQFYQLVIPDNDYADIDSRAGIFNRILSGYSEYWQYAQDQL